MRIRDQPTAPRSPWKNGHFERLIGSIRRESLDHLIVVGEAHLRCIPKAYSSYYNEVRARLSLDRDAPEFRRAQKIGRIAATPILSGLHHQYVLVSVLVGTTVSRYLPARSRRPGRRGGLFLAIKAARSSIPSLQSSADAGPQLESCWDQLERSAVTQIATPGSPQARLCPAAILSAPSRAAESWL